MDAMRWCEVGLGYSKCWGAQQALKRVTGYSGFTGCGGYRREGNVRDREKRERKEEQ